jgi:3-phenylpropionate/cinnamic acid dioxygenase small subunit
VTDAHHAIARLVYLYAERVDAGDFEGVGALFADATYRAEAGGNVATMDGAGVASTLQAMVILYPSASGDGGRPTPSTKHLTTNLIIEIDGDAAVARSYFTVLQSVDGSPMQPIIAGRYHDRFVRDGAGGEWRFADRLIFSDLLGDLSHHLNGNPYGA